MKATFENTVDILVKAYLKGTLRHGSCSACAVGNIVGSGEWAKYFITTNVSTLPLQELRRSNGRYHQKIYPGVINNANDLVSHTGYTWEQLADIEFAFESIRKSRSIDSDEDMFNGLMAVVDVLADIHGIDLNVKEEAKLLFVKS